jgi:hypothetical protein
MTRLFLTLLALVLMSDAAAALPCLSKSQAMERGDSPRYREVDGRKCWYVGKRTPKKSEFLVQKTSLKKPMKSRASSISEPEKTNLDVKPVLLETNHIGDANEMVIRHGGPAPEQARLGHAFQSLTAAWAAHWHTQLQLQAIFGSFRLDYAQRWPAWEMASRFHGD